ncbi:unnamed protein product [Amoebophrya sp. A120]|nr:unnamed protein product [Amoebophrya sp. A120]|eukprot:GSA120T00025099001.1
MPLNLHAIVTTTFDMHIIPGALSQVTICIPTISIVV